MWGGGEGMCLHIRARKSVSSQRCFPRCGTCTGCALRIEANSEENERPGGGAGGASARRRRRRGEGSPRDHRAEKATSARDGTQKKIRYFGEDRWIRRLPQRDGRPREEALRIMSPQRRQYWLKLRRTSTT